jgi:hypothetical protein
MTKESKPLKSAYELAMERLKAEDKKKGVSTRPLTSKQKVEIQRLREEAKARLAEIEILYRDNRAAAAADPERTAELEEIDEHYATDRRRVESSLESAINGIKKG